MNTASNFLNTIHSFASPYFEGAKELGASVIKKADPVWQAASIGFQYLDENPVKSLAGICALVGGVAIYKNRNQILNTLFSRAFEFKSAKAAETLLNLGILDVNSLNWDGRKRLEQALRHDRPDIARLLIERGANINAADQNGLTPLHIALNRGLFDIARLLIERGANLNAADQNGLTPLNSELRIGQVDIARLLIERGANINAADRNGLTPLHIALNRGLFDIARLLIERGANINASSHSGRTPLHEASSSGYLDIARLLIERGANLNAADQNGLTPLFWALGEGHVDIARLLVEKGVDVHGTMNSNNLVGTPYSFAAINHPECLKFLLDEGVNIHARPRNSFVNLIHGAVVVENQESIQLLLDNGAKLDSRVHFGGIDRLANDLVFEGDTPLLIAIRIENPAIVRQLLGGGARISDNALKLAREKGNKEIEQLLIDWGGYEENQEGRTALGKATLLDASAQMPEAVFDHEIKAFMGWREVPPQT